MKVIILAGGFGTRLQEETTIKPKPMVEIGGQPILWHIINIYAAHGFKEFIVALGYKGEIIKSYFLNHFYSRNDLSVHLSDGRVDIHNPGSQDSVVHLIDTGDRTATGGRVKRLSSWVGGETFMLTYGDGVADIDVQKLLQFHRSHGRLATITAVRPPARFGSLVLDGDLVVRFEEKPQIGEGWINGGFFVLESEVLNYIQRDETSFEQEPLQRLAEDGQLAVYRHTGFWQCMDTLRDVRVLESLWAEGNAPWRVLEE